MIIQFKKTFSYVNSTDMAFSDEAALTIKAFKTIFKKNKLKKAAQPAALLILK
jgi:hypothetical protein